jgi:alkyl sulfatase BDS1-like metallo-beta-lactamase superfamily hydrolase
VKAPPHLLERPYLRPLYDEPEFIVRNLFRLYGGWYDGNPAHLKPGRDADLAREIATLAGGAARLAERARALSTAGEHATACHLAEMAHQAAPADKSIKKTRSDVYRARAEIETSLMARNIFTAAADEEA